MHDGPAIGKTIIVTYNRKKNFQFHFRGKEYRDSKEVNISLLVVNKLVNNEAVPMLYQGRTFDFRTSVGDIEPFLSSLPEGARQSLHGIAMELHNKRESGGDEQDNQAAWVKSCDFIAKNVSMGQLSLSLTINVKVHAGFKTLKWVTALVKIKGIRHFTLSAHQYFSHEPVTIRANYKGSSVSAADHCFSEHLVALFHYLCEQMLE